MPSSDWKRIGECNRCGDCCKGYPWMFDANDEGSSILPQGHSHNGGCPLLSFNGVASCSGYQTHPFYNSHCANFPDHPSAIADLPNCSYRFEYVGERTEASLLKALAIWRNAWHRGSLQDLQLAELEMLDELSIYEAERKHEP